MTNSFYWHDYETFGTDPQRDKVAQFAGIRTDYEFNILEEPVTFYCRPADDCLPHPEACLVTGITPQLAKQKGIIEAEFAARIHAELSKAGTCTLGYNNLRFDDEVTRNLFYRNFYDPYAREWQNGNSRWDLIDVVRVTRALRPDGIIWPEREGGLPSFKLEDLTQANKIEHASAHDALSDVYATIAIARLISQKQPRLYQFLLQHRSKHAVQQLLKLGSYTPLVHVSGMYPSSKLCLAVVLPLCLHPTNNNGVIVYDLSVNPEAIINLDIDEIKNRVFTAAADLPDNIDRIPLKTVHINKCPVLAPVSVIRPEDKKRLKLDYDSIERHLEKIKQATGLAEKIAAVFDQQFENKFDDPELMLYGGGFFSSQDKAEMEKVRNSTPTQLAQQSFNFQDKRLPELLLRYKARNYPEILADAERQQWLEYCKEVLTVKEKGPLLTLTEFNQKLDDLAAQPDADLSVIESLGDYSGSLQQKFLQT